MWPTATLCIPAIAAAELLAERGIEAAVINARFAKPLDEELLADLGTNFTRILTVEEGALPGGFGDAVLEFYPWPRQPCRAEDQVHRPARRVRRARPAGVLARPLQPVG